MYQDRRAAGECLSSEYKQETAVSSSVSTVVTLKSAVESYISESFSPRLDSTRADPYLNFGWRRDFRSIDQALVMSQHFYRS